VFIVALNEVEDPAPVAGGEEVSITASWMHGKAPFTLHWGFPEGFEPRTIDAQAGEERSQTVTVRAPEGHGNFAFLAQVDIIDPTGYIDADAFTVTRLGLPGPGPTVLTAE
jgi:hypothetical protein